MSQTINNENDLRNAPGWVHITAWGSFGVISLILLILYFLYRETDVWFLLLNNEARSTHVFGEAIWHVLTAVTLVCMAIFYRSEIPRTDNHIEQEIE